MKKFFRILGILLVVIPVIPILIISIQNWKTSALALFIEYWKLSVPCTVIMIIGAILYEANSD